MTRRNWLKTLAGGVAALCGAKAVAAQVSVNQRGGITSREAKWVEVEDCTITFHGIQCDYPAPPRVMTCVVTLPPGTRAYTTPEAP